MGYVDCNSFVSVIASLYLGYVFPNRSDISRTKKDSIFPYVAESICPRQEIDFVSQVQFQKNFF